MAAHKPANERPDAPDALRLGTPLTERVLARLGPPRYLWIVLWASTALVTLVLFRTALSLAGKTDPRSFLDLFGPQAGLGYGALVALWGIGRLTRAARALNPEFSAAAPQEDRLSRLRGAADIAGPLVLTAAVMLGNQVTLSVVFAPAVALAVLIPQTQVILPLMTFVWTYLRLLLGLARLGRARLALDPFPQDRTLGLGPVGSIAFTGFGLLFAIAVPIVIVNLDDPLTTTIALLVLLVSVPVFFLSMWRLHHQMTEAKDRYVEDARRLYKAAYEPVRTNPTVEALNEQSRALSAAQALEERAHKVLEWPISEGVTAVIAVIFVGVVTSLIVRVIFIAAGY